MQHVNIPSDDNEVSFVKANLSTQLGEPDVILPGEYVSATPAIPLGEEDWQGGTGEFTVSAIYDTTDYKDEGLWANKAQSKAR